MQIAGKEDNVCLYICAARAGKQEDEEDVMGTQVLV